MASKLLKLLGVAVVLGSLVLGVVLLNSCSTPPKLVGDVVNPVDDAEDLDVYMRLFAVEAEKRGLNININRLFFDLRLKMVDQFRPSYEREGVIGLCSYEANTNTVYISRRAWDAYDSLQREMLIFHEFGHCVLGLEHDEATNYESVPDDLMYPVNFSSVYYARERDAYLTRLFGKVAERVKNGEDPVKRNTNITSYRCRWGKKDGRARYQKSNDGSVRSLDRGAANMLPDRPSRPKRSN